MTMSNSDTCTNFISWYKDSFGFTALATTTLHDIQMLKDKATLPKLDNGVIDKFCHLIH